MFIINTQEFQSYNILRFDYALYCSILTPECPCKVCAGTHAECTWVKIKILFRFHCSSSVLTS